MKSKHLILFILFLIVSEQLSSQYVRWGLKGGPNISNIFSLNEDTPHMGGQGGFLVSYPITPRLKGEVELMVMVARELYYGDIDPELYISYSYNFRRYFLNDFFLEIGPLIGVNLLGNEYLTFGLNFGLGYSIIPGICLNARYYQGFRDFNYSSQRSSLLEGSDVHGQIQLSLECTLETKKIRSGRRTTNR